MSLFQKIQAFFFSLWFFILCIPYGSAPVRVTLESGTFDNGALVCTTDGDGAKADISLCFRNNARPLRNSVTDYFLTLKVFRLSPDETEEDAPYFGYLYEDEEYPPMDVTYTYQIADAPAIIKEGDTFRVDLHLQIAPEVEPDTYSLGVRIHNDNEIVFRNALIVQ